MEEIDNYDYDHLVYRISKLTSHNEAVEFYKFLQNIEGVLTPDEYMNLVNNVKAKAFNLIPLKNK